VLKGQVNRPTRTYLDALPNTYQPPPEPSSGLERDVTRDLAAVQSM
jgi:hypothetical protein